MSDVWAAVAELDAGTQTRLADVLEIRGADPQQQAMRRAFLAEVAFPMRARVLEVGCGTGVLTRALASLRQVAAVVAVDLAAPLLMRARELAASLTDVTFQEADARSLPFEQGSFDAVVFDSTLSHVPGPEYALAEAFRVLRPAGVLAVFDGDYATATVALGDHDPLQTCVDAMMAGSVHDRWLVRRLPALVRSCGFESARLRSYGFVETSEAGYVLTVVDRGADTLRALGHLGDDAAAALKAEARRRIETGTFFGHVAYGSLVASRPPRRPASGTARV
jgi:ubiquinone/menaquinone biosynthesis C-methylase UbiE